MKPKTLHNSDPSGALKNVSDLKVFGDMGEWVLICKASSESEGWMKSTKAMNLKYGCLIQVTTQQRNPDGSYSLAEALTYAPDAIIIKDSTGVRRME